MTSKVLDKVLSSTPKFRHRGSRPSSYERNLTVLSSDALAAWGMDHSADLNYRVELARRIALTFDDADQLILFDDISMIISDTQRPTILGMRGFDRSLLPGLWLSTGFRRGGRILVYAPPNTVEMSSYLTLKNLIEQRLQRKITIEILYEDETGQLHELISLFEQNQDKYISLCEDFLERSIDEFYSEYHVDMLIRYLDRITNGVRRSFVFPYETTEYHVRELQPYADRLILPDLPTSNKAQHNLYLRSKGYTDIPYLFAVTTGGSVIDTYDQYIDYMKHFDPICIQNTSENIENFSRGVVQAIDHLYYKYDRNAFVKLDAEGAAGWSCVSPKDHSIIYDCTQDQEHRVTYLREYIESKVIGESLPVFAVVEEFIEPQKRAGNIDADYTVCGFVLNGKFFPTSINLCGTDNGAYIEQWTSALPADLHDTSVDWQRMFHTYSSMVACESSEFGYKNGIYAGDLFMTKDGQLKQRDWNIRRGGRSSPETLTIFGMPNYETKVVLHLSEFGLDGKFTKLELFKIYTLIGERLKQDYGIYIFSSGYGYCCEENKNGDFLKFNVLVHPKWLNTIDRHGEEQKLARDEHRNRVTELVRDTAARILGQTIM